MEPQADRLISAIPAEAATYQWFRTTSRSSDGTAIAGPEGTGSTYLPIHLRHGGASDIGQYLRVEATYTDGRWGRQGGRGSLAVQNDPRDQWQRSPPRL